MIHTILFVAAHNVLKQNADQSTSKGYIAILYHRIWNLYIQKLIFVCAETIRMNVTGLVEQKQTRHFTVLNLSKLKK